MPVSAKEIASNSVLSAIISKSSNLYKNQQEIQEYLSSLYGANFDTNVELYGDVYNIEFMIEFINKKFLPDNEDVLKDLLKFLNDIIYNPIFKENHLDSDFLEREKSFILDKIKARKDDKIRYAISKTEEIMCEGEPMSASIYGFENDVKNVKSEDIYRRYIEVIEKSCIIVSICGNLEGYENINDDIEEIFGYKLNSKLDYENLVVDTRNNEKKIENIKEIIEKQDTNQSVITFGLRVKNATPNDYYILNLYNAVLGSTPSSKLFQIFREKESLAYTVRSRFYRFKNIILIFAGIEKKNYDKSKEVVMDILENIKNLNITDEEFNASKQSLISDILEWNDSKFALSKMHISNLIATKKDDITLEEMVDKIKSITKEDLRDIARKIVVEKIYLLGGESDA
jgi:predicted Zn-dependent peptidase